MDMSWRLWTTLFICTQLRSKHHSVRILINNGLFHLLKIHPHRRVNLDTPSRLQLILQKTLKTLIDFEEFLSRHIKIACDPLDAINFGYKYPQDKSSSLLSSQCVRQLDNNLTLCVPFHTPLWYFDPQDR